MELSSRTITARVYLRLFRVGLTCSCFPTNRGTTGASGVKRQMVKNHDVRYFAYFPANPQKRRADEWTRTAFLLITSVRSVVAESCRGLQIPHRQRVYCSLYCPLLHGIAPGLGSN